MDGAASPVVASTEVAANARAAAAAKNLSRGSAAAATADAKFQARGASPGSADAPAASQATDANQESATPAAAGASATASMSAAFGALLVGGDTPPKTAASDAKPVYLGAQANDSQGADSSAAPVAGLAGAAVTPAAIAPVQPEANATLAAGAAALGATITADKHPQGSGDSVLQSASGADAAAGLSQLATVSSAGSASAAPAAAPTMQITSTVGSAEFSQGLSERVSWMVGNGVNSAKLQVNPPQLGPIELNIVVQGDHAQVSMATHSAVTRDALESTSPQLKEMLGAQGFGQVSVDISQRSFQDRSAYTPPSYAPAYSTAGDTVVSTAAVDAVAPASRATSGVLDAYA